MTLLLAANVTDTRSLPLLVIEKALKPRYFYIKHLSVEYCANRKAWMTSEIFRACLQEHLPHFSAKKCKVRFMGGNCTAHCNVSNLEAIRLVFFPPSTSAALQLMDQGIIQYAKKRYRKQVLEHMLLCMDRKQQYNITFLSATHIFMRLWANALAELVTVLDIVDLCGPRHLKSRSLRRQKRKMTLGNLLACSPRKFSLPITLRCRNR